MAKLAGNIDYKSHRFPQTWWFGRCEGGKPHNLEKDLHCYDYGGSLTYD